MTFFHAIHREDEDVELIVEVSGFFEGAELGDCGDWPGQRGSPPYHATFILESIRHNGHEIDCTDNELDELIEYAMRIGED